LHPLAQKRCGVNQRHQLFSEKKDTCKSPGVVFQRRHFLYEVELDPGGPNEGVHNKASGCITTTNHQHRRRTNGAGNTKELIRVVQEQRTALKAECPAYLRRHVGQCKEVDRVQCFAHRFQRHGKRLAAHAEQKHFHAAAVARHTLPQRLRRGDRCNGLPGRTRFRRIADVGAIHARVKYRRQ
jgi:hypothetical protein